MHNFGGEDDPQYPLFVANQLKMKHQQPPETFQPICRFLIM
jgi:hypothetical protein